MTIHQFRATLSGRSEPGALVRAYRELAHRPDRAAAMLSHGWIPWEQVTAPAAKA
jgi:hypothetical protein